MRDDGGMTSSNGGKRLVRRRDGLMAGVCAGLADYLGMDVNLIRVLTVGIAIVTFSGGLFVYLIAWLIVPEEGKETSIAEDLLGKNRQR